MPTAKTVIEVVTNSLTCDGANKKIEAEVSAVERCVQLLEHAGECRTRGTCVDGQHCHRACRVLLHHRACSSEHCSVCRQLKHLCHLHASRCQKKDNSCNMPFCPNGKELLHVARSFTGKITTEAPAAPTSGPSAPVDRNRCVLTEVKSAGSLKCQSAEDAKRVTGTSRLPRINLSVTSRPFHHSSLKRHFSDNKLRCPISCGKVLASNKETLQASLFSWKAKVSMVPLK